MKNYMTLSVRLAALCLLASALCLTGCVGRQLTPAFVAVGAQTLVATTLRNSPQTATEMELASKILCAASGGTNVTPQTIHDSLPAEQFSLSTIALLNGLQIIFTQATEAGSRFTTKDYARAIFCEGIPAGLAQLPTGPRLGPVPRGQTRAIPIYSPHDPRFGLWETP